MFEDLKQKFFKKYNLESIKFNDGIEGDKARSLMDKLVFDTMRSEMLDVMGLSINDVSNAKEKLEEL